MVSTSTHKQNSPGSRLATKAKANSNYAKDNMANEEGGGRRASEHTEETASRGTDLS